MPSRGRRTSLVPQLEYLSDKIERVQQQATSMLPGMNGISYAERLRKLKLTTLKSRRLRGDMIETYKILHEEYEPAVAPPLALRINQPGRGAPRLHPLTLSTQRSVSQVRRGTSFPVWNSLAASVKDAPSVNCFKARLDKEWEGEDILYDPKARLSKIPILT